MFAREIVNRSKTVLILLVRKQRFGKVISCNVLQIFNSVKKFKIWGPLFFVLEKLFAYSLLYQLLLGFDCFGTVGLRSERGLEQVLKTHFAVSELCETSCIEFWQKPNETDDVAVGQLLMAHEHNC